MEERRPTVAVKKTQAGAGADRPQLHEALGGNRRGRERLTDR